MSSPFNNLLLEALSNNDQEKYKRIIDLLRAEAEKVAVVNIPEDSLGAVDYAIDKVEDWLATDQPFNKRYPFAYARYRVRTKVIDYIRMHKGTKPQEERDDETAPEHKVGFGTLHRSNKLAGGEAEALTTQIDGLGFDPGKRQLIPWRVETYKEKRAKPSKAKYPAENGLLLRLPELNGWGCYSREAKQAREEKYLSIKAIIEGIQNTKERAIIKRYLWNHPNRDIAGELSVSPSYISQVTHKLIYDIWNWNEAQLQQVKLLLATHHIAEVRSQWWQQIEKDNLKSPRRSDTPLEQKQIAFLRQRLANDPETKAYFGKGELSDSELIKICEGCYGYWDLDRKLDHPPLKSSIGSGKEKIDDWEVDEEWEAGVERRDREDRTKQIAQLPPHKRKLYINCWRDQADEECEGDEEALQRELDFLAELERTFCKTTGNT